MHEGARGQGGPDGKGESLKPRSQKRATPKRRAREKFRIYCPDILATKAHEIKASKTLG